MKRCEKMQNLWDLERDIGTCCGRASLIRTKKIQRMEARLGCKGFAWKTVSEVGIEAENT